MAAEALRENLQDRLELNQRPETKIAAVERKQVERSRVDSARPGPTHVQPGEVRPAVDITGYDLAIEHHTMRSVDDLAKAMGSLASLKVRSLACAKNPRTCQNVPFASY